MKHRERVLSALNHETPLQNFTAMHGTILNYDPRGKLNLKVIRGVPAYRDRCGSSPLRQYR